MKIARRILSVGHNTVPISSPDRQPHLDQSQECSKYSGSNKDGQKFTLAFCEKFQHDAVTDDCTGQQAKKSCDDSNVQPYIHANKAADQYTDHEQPSASLLVVLFAAFLK